MSSISMMCYFLIFNLNPFYVLAGKAMNRVKYVEFDFS